jgi:ribosomal protein S3
LKLIFKNLILASKDFEGKNKKSILGIKLIVSGKIKGKPRSSTTCIQVGSVPSQSLDKDVDFSKLHVYTLYGVFGFKIWIYKKLKN